MWTTTERDAWLGPARDTMTDDQLDRLDSLAAEIMAQWPASEDDPTAGTEQLTGALMIILGDDTLAGLGAARQRAQAALDKAHAQLLGALLASRDLGPSEISRQAGLSRVTVTKTLQG